MVLLSAHVSHKYHNLAYLGTVRYVDESIAVSMCELECVRACMHTCARANLLMID